MSGNDGLDLVQRALVLFRQRYGIWANPEDFPVLWQGCLDAVESPAPPQEPQ